MYTSGTYITDPIGNNEFSYPERIALGSVAKIFVPSLVQGSPDDLEIGSEICFEEAVKGKLISCRGLKHFIQTGYEGISVYIVDNHNHALSFRGDGMNIVIHIDQHADTKPNNEIMAGDRERFVNEKTNVGNFISAALANGIIDEVVQVRSDYALHHFDASAIQQGSVIVDIDVDFRADKEITPEDIRIIRKLMRKAKLVTIATSPYFMEQKKAIEIVRRLLV